MTRRNFSWMLGAAIIGATLGLRPPVFRNRPKYARAMFSIVQPLTDPVTAQFELSHDRVAVLSEEHEAVIRFDGVAFSENAKDWSDPDASRPWTLNTNVAGGGVALMPIVPGCIACPFVVTVANVATGANLRVDVGRRS